MRFFDFTDVGLPDALLNRVASSPKTCRALAEILDIEQDDSEDVGEFIQSEIKVWLARRRFARANESLDDAHKASAKGEG